MTDAPEVLDLRSAQQWEQWLEHHHDTGTAVWLRLFNGSLHANPIAAGRSRTSTGCSA